MSLPRCSDKARIHSKSVAAVEMIMRVEQCLILVLAMALFFHFIAGVLGRYELKDLGHGWEAATATFYGDMSGNETMQGACGYGNLFDQGYGLETTALSTELFNHGKTCGACYQIVCNSKISKLCLDGVNVIHVTATNFCPPNFSPGPGHWCNPPNKHFDLSQPMFRKIAEYRAGIVAVYYRRTHCLKKGGMKFEFNGNPYWILVLVYNVGGVGDVVDVKVKGTNTGWSQMTRNWGVNWQTSLRLQGQALSFRVTTSDGQMVQSDNVAPADWKFRQSFSGGQFR